MRFTKTFECVVLAALVLAAGAEGAETGTFKIVYKPAPGILYNVQLMRMRTDKAAEASSKPVLFDVNQAVSRDVQATPDGNLTVTHTVLGEDSFHSEQKVQLNAEVTPAEPPRTGEAITPRGERLNAIEPDDIHAVLAPVFPDAAIAPGHKWETQIEFPLTKKPVTVKHEFVEVEMVDGMPCAYIVSEFELKKATNNSGVQFSSRGNGRTSVSLTDGTLISSHAFIAYVDAVAAKDGEPAAGTRREFLRTMSRRPPDPAGGAAPGK